MIFGKHINRYYLRYLPMLLMGIAALLAVDYFQLIIPSLYQMVINGMNTGQVVVNGAAVPFDMDFLMNQISGQRRTCGTGCSATAGTWAAASTTRTMWETL